MSDQSFRFLHATGFRLQDPIRGVIDASGSFRELLIDAPYASAEAVFGVAIREEVDFLVLSGDLFDPTKGGPRSISFLQEQFSQLEEREISVYWAASEMDMAGGLARSIEWPDNVQLFSADSVERISYFRGDVQLAEIIGRSWNSARSLRAAEYQSEASEYFRLAAVPGRMEIQGERESIDYWALGGMNAVTPFEGRSMAHCPGCILGLTPQKTGAHGCTLVLVDADHTVRTRMIPTDAVRWCHERIPVSLGVSHQESRRMMKSRIKHLSAEIGRPMLVVWTITGDSRFDTLFVQADDREEMLTWLRAEYSEATPPLWSASLELEPANMLPPEWSEEDSILGDYLRIVQSYESDTEKTLDLDQALSKAAPSELIRALSKSGGARRDELLRAAALMGADLLRGDD
jgi:exonuclease SbcD